MHARRNLILAFVLASTFCSTTEGYYNVYYKVTRSIDRAAATGASETWKFSSQVLPPLVPNFAAATDQYSFVGPDGAIIASGVASGAQTDHSLSFPTYDALRAYVAGPGHCRFILDTALGHSVYTLAPDFDTLDVTRFVTTNPTAPIPGQVLTGKRPTLSFRIFTSQGSLTR